ncbi:MULTISPECIES: error-prone DNA polymerase [unclassified Nocardioides]|uniref:error-prone DNA polymerase n=1 Tax=unclassified Nocardioides TaxID=2615069 RepID=UPI000702B08B|nr:MULTISPECIES: error-prone DNA polymerase [unclassified Nocardioides]KRC50310.1 DNA polymerase III subunit alpha [Nocardioides sp. Root79]KRC75778.1 DNA polymerase III subunit alpha [Nocardioides sp. Root240]
MGWNNPPVPWRELERRLSGRAPDMEAPVSRRKRPRAEPEQVVRPDGAPPYAELHCHTHFSFLDGASSPGELVKEATRLGLTGLALTDHDGFAGAPLFAEAGRDYDLPTVYGAELSLDLTRTQNGVPDPEGSHLLVLARGVEGYHRLSGAITEAGLRAPEKGSPAHDLDELAERGRGHWLVLTGCRKGAVRQALAAHGPRAAGEQVDLLVDRFGRENVVVEVIASSQPGADETNELLARVADDRRLPVVATGNVHHATPEGRRLAAAMAAIRARRSIAELEGWLDLSGGAHLRSGEEMLRLFGRRPEVVGRSAVLADELAFDLRKASPQLPKQGIPEGLTPGEHLRDLVERGFAKRYAHEAHAAKARERIENEMRVILEKDFAGYFVIVHDIVAFARDRGILCQGRGSAASSAVCYALGITAIDSVYFNLPFERFISQHREEEPDIDVDFDSDRREEVIQWVYDTYGRRNAAQVCNVVSYRPRMAVRDAAKALGFSPGQQDAWSKSIDGWGSAVEADQGIPPQVVALAEELMGAPRHLGIHSGGMVLTERPIGEVCPIEKARMDNRTVLQWDKDGCESMGLVKFDLLGLGMLGALDHMMQLIDEHTGRRWTLESIPKEEPEVYDMLCRADSIGVFQVESRAQIGTLPRLKPRSFYDLAIEIALIRPGPIQGGAVHPYIRRATGREAVTYDHPSLVPILGRTLGVPLFQEQLMQMAVALGDCSHDDADLLRRAMGSKRGIERIEKVKDKLYEGMEEKGITGDRADAIYVKILSFAGFGFAESHALSFALLVYASSWFKLRYPAAFLAGLLRNQPMGFYSPQSLVADARRHGVTVLPPDLARSGVQAGLEPCPPYGRDRHRYDDALAVRLGLDAVKGIGKDVAERIVAERAVAPYPDLPDLSRRVGLTSTQLESLATAGAFDSLGLDRRQAIWMAGYAEHDGQLPGSTPAPAPPVLPGMSPMEVTLADLWATRISTDVHPVEHFRDQLAAAGIRAVGDLSTAEAGRRVHVAGLITHRQRPGTASGITFLNLEDETGMLNVVCSPGVMKAHRQAARNKVAVVIRGLLEREDGVTNLVADRIESLDTVLPGTGAALQARQSSRDFR